MVISTIAYVIGALITCAFVVYVFIKDYGKFTVGDLIFTITAAALSWLGLLLFIIACLSKYTIYKKKNKQ